LTPTPQRRATLLASKTAARPVFDLQAAGVNPYTNLVSTQFRRCTDLMHVSPTHNMLELQ
jgi:hypothetical protein